MQHIWGRGEVHTGFWWGNLWVRDLLEDPGVDGGYYLNGFSGTGIGAVDRIDLAQNRDRWRVLVNAVMNFMVR